MNCFLTEFKLASVELPHDHKEDFLTALEHVASNTLKGSLLETYKPAQQLEEDFLSIKEWSISSASLDFGKSFFRCCFSQQEVYESHSTYSLLFSNNMENVHINSAFRKYQKVTYKGVLYHTNTKMPLALAYTSHSQHSVCVRPVHIHYFVKHSIQYNGSLQTFCLVAVSWLKEHGSRDILGKPLQIWWKDLYHNHLAFIPVQYLFGPCVCRDYVLEGQTVLLLSSVPHCRFV